MKYESFTVLTILEMVRDEIIDTEKSHPHIDVTAIAGGKASLHSCAGKFARMAIAADELKTVVELVKLFPLIVDRRFSGTEDLRKYLDKNNVVY
jgi:hypothetical protein